MHRTIINEIAQKAGLDENETGDFAFCEKIALKEQRQSLSCWMPRQRKTAV